MKNKAVFIDRDGTLNYDSSYINNPEDFDFYDFVYPAIDMLIKNGYKIIIVSNQAGIGKGYITENQLEQITQKMHKLLELKSMYVDDVFYAYYYDKSENPKYRKFPELRKPNPGMLVKAAEKHNIDIAKSYMIGDRISDIGAGKNAGCKTILVKTGDGLKNIELLEKSDLKADYIFDNFLKACEFIVSQ